MTGFDDSNYLDPPDDCGCMEQFLEDGGRDADDMSQAAHDVIDERLRQWDKEGWTPEHDDIHVKGELARAAAQYAILAAWPDEVERKVLEGGDYSSVPFRASHLSGEIPIWPFAPAWLKPTTRRRDLVKAGALILAEIERLDRLTKPIT